MSSLLVRATVRDKGSKALSPASLIFLGIMIIALLLGITTGLTGSYTPAIVVGACSMAIMFFLRRDEWAALFILMIHLYVDWYMGLLVVAQILACILLVIFFLERCDQYPWSKPRALWLWGIFLTLALFPALQGSLSRYDAAYYYPNIMFGALLMFWVGTILAKDITHVRCFFKLLAGAGALLATITIIQDKTGILFLGVSRFDIFLAQVSNYSIFQGSDVYRLGSFFVNPDWNGAFFAFMLYIPLGLFIECDFFLEKVLYLAEAFIILPALLFTYSIGAWISTGAGMIVFIVLSGRTRYRVWISLFLAIATILLFIVFPSQITLLFQHGSDPADLLLRGGGWQTAMKVIKAFPFTGIGLGLQAYMLRAEPYRVPEQYRVLAHPHNSYLELGAMAGLPVLVIFVALILFGLWQALHNRALLDSKQRSLLGCGIAAVVVISANSFGVNIWTLPPLAAFGWIILGLVSSPLLAKYQRSACRSVTLERADQKGT